MLPINTTTYVFTKNYRKRTKPIKRIVLHWDAGVDVTGDKIVDAADTYKILLNRGLSTHYTVDNDGVIYQMLDPSLVAYHAGIWNGTSIGVDICNIVQPVNDKTKKQYKDNWGERPIIASIKLNGAKYTNFFGFYDKQISQTLRLIDYLCGTHNIKRAIPSKLYETCIASLEWEGVCGHYHISKNKWDPLSFPFEKIRVDVAQLSRS